MPKDLDEPIDMEAESSTAPVLDETADAPAADATPADSSAATDVPEADTLSVVRDVVDASKKDDAEAAPSAEGEEGTPETDDTPVEQDDENFSDVPFNQHPRFKQLLAKAKAHEQDAVRYQNVERFLGEVNINADEAANVMTIAGLAKTNPPKAWEQVKGWVQELLVAAGEVLPQDLAQMVTNKQMTQEAALEVSRSRAQLRAAEASTKFQQERGQRQQQTQQGRALVDTAEQWVSSRRIRDPNFAAKEARLMERIAFLQRTEGRPNTADGVKAQLKKAYDAVNKDFRPAVAAAPAAAPARRPAITPVRGGQVASTGTQPKPTTTLEAIRAVKARAS